MAHPVAVLICGLQEHVQKRSSFLCALVRVAFFNVGNVLRSFLYHLRRNDTGKAKSAWSPLHFNGLNTGHPLISITHFGCKGVQDLEGLVVHLAFTKEVVYNVRPKPRCPLSAADNVTHSEDKKLGKRHKHEIIYPLSIVLY